VVAEQEVRKEEGGIRLERCWKEREAVVGNDLQYRPQRSRNQALLGMG